MLYFFEEYALDTDRREIRRAEGLLQVEPKVFDLLTLLIARRDRVLSKEDLIAGVWMGRVVSDSALTSCINAARATIGDNGESQHLIKTLRGRGIRFVGTVREENSAAGPAPPSAAASLRLFDLGDEPSSTLPPQEVRYVAGAGGVQLAYAITGSGYPILKCANWMSDLQYDRESSVWAHWIAGLSARNQLVRYDQRGNGLSDRSVEDLSFDAQLADLEAVADAACPSRFALLGISAGAALSVAYAVRHPERVSHLILYGGRQTGWRLTSGEELERRTAMASLIRVGWGQDIPAFRQLFSSLFIPDGTPEQMDWYNELQRRTVSPENAARLYEVNGNVDVSGILGRVTAPTLVLHAAGDALVPFDCGRALAIGIPKARFALLDSRNHILLSHDLAFGRFLEELRRFVNPPASGPAA